MRKTTTFIGTALAVALTMSGCSSKAADSGGSGGTEEGNLKTDFGVTDTEITLGIQTDTSGAFKVGGLGQTHGNELWAKDINDAGGICGRKIVLDTQDNGYKADNALPIYEAQKPKILGYLQLLGSPILAALKAKITQDKVLSVPGSWASSNLDSEAVLMIGQTYDVEMINGLSYLMEEGKIAKGDKLGHIYIDSEYGQNGLLGAQAFAKEHDMELVPVAISASDTDMTSTVTKLRTDGVKAILLTVTPNATASVAVQAKAQGMNIPILGNNPTFAPTMLTDDTVVAALDNYIVVTSIASMSDQEPFMQEIVKKYQAAYTDAPYDAVQLGYTYGMAWEAILKQACKDGDMTRDGIYAARKKVTKVDTKGLTGPLDFSVQGAPSTRQAFITQADKSAISGSKTLKALYESEEAKNYKAPFQQ